MTKKKTNSRDVDRRRVLQALGVGAAAGLAGCSGGSGDDSGGDEPSDGSGGNESGDGSGDGDGSSGGGGGSSELGERVPAIEMTYWANLGSRTTIMESEAPVVKRNLEERLGLTVESVPEEFTANLNNIIEDTRKYPLTLAYHTSTPDRLDPFEMVRRFGADWAGANGRANVNNWANCEYTDLAVEQSSATSEEEREETVMEALSIMSEAVASIEFAPDVMLGAARSDTIELGGTDAGIARTNPHVYIKSKPKEGDTFAANIYGTDLESTNFPIQDSSATQGLWNHIVHSPLTEYDETYELQNVLASDYSVENDGKKITVELRDATFHNGDPITGEDVKFTFEQLANNTGAYPQASQPPYESIEVVDDKTVAFRFTRPFLPLITRVWPRWGIFHKQTWIDGGAKEDAESVELDPIIGSGPFSVSEFQAGQILQVEAHDGHPVHEPEHGIDFRVYRNEQTTFQAFKAGEIHLFSEVSPNILSRIESEMGDGAQTVAAKGFMPWGVYPQCSFSPSKFREFRAAVGAAINRQEINEVALRGRSEPQMYSCPLQGDHPFRPPDDQLHKFSDSPTGDAEAARAYLEDAGWGWDDNGRLHYPADADLSPLWPKGEMPGPPEFPCMSEDGEYVPPEER